MRPLPLVSARLASVTSRYADMAPVAPACCNVCRTCTTNNVVALASGAALATVAFVRRTVRRRR